MRIIKIFLKSNNKKCSHVNHKCVVMAKLVTDSHKELVSSFIPVKAARVHKEDKAVGKVWEVNKAQE
jgi:hypothetical protein